MKLSILTLLLLGLTACPIAEAPSPADLWSPESRSDGIFEVERYPFQVESCRELQPSWTPEHGRLIGDSTGLYQLGTEPTQLSTEAVWDLVGLGEQGLLLAGQTGLEVYDSARQASPLQDNLGEVMIRHLSQGEDALWLGGTDGLFRLREGRLASMGELLLVDLTAIDGNQALVHELGAAPMIISEVDGQLKTAIIDLPEGMTQLAVPTSQRYHARNGEGWWVTLDNEASGSTWQGLSLSPEGNSPVTDLWNLVADPSTGGVWALTSDQIIFLQGDLLTVMDKPADIGRPYRAVVDRYGSLWLLCGPSSPVIRIGGPQDSVVTWEGRIDSFNRANCQECHDGTGGERNLSGVSQWRENVDQIIDAVASQRMPQNGNPLVGGSVDLLRRWKAGGMLE